MTLYARVACSLCVFLSSNTLANPVYQAAGPNLVLGNVSHNNSASTLSNNPAAGEANSDYLSSRYIAGSISFGAGLEYGNVDDIFAAIDRIGESLGGGDGGGDGDNNGGSPGEPANLPVNPSLRDIIDANPRLQQWISDVQNEAVLLGAALAVIAVEGYAKGFLSSDIPAYLSDDVWDGSLAISFSGSRSIKALGIVDNFDFDLDEALDVLDQIRFLDDDAESTDFALSDDLLLRIDPSRNSTRLIFTNDSTLLTKSVEIFEAKASYSRELYSNANGKLYVGVSPKLLRVGLSQVGVRFDDITDSEALFEDLLNADLEYDNGLSLDLGIIWASDRYMLGASLLDPLSPEFEFPFLDLSRYTNPTVIGRLRDESTYEMEAQLNLEASVFSERKIWNVHFGLEANPVVDPVGDEYQWASVSASFKTNSTWIPALRTGLRSNLVGSELTYLGAGITLFKFLTFDIASTMETVELDGTELPRGFHLSLGANYRI